MRFMATTVKGMEDIAAKEIEELGGTHTQIRSERVFFNGDLDLMYRINIMSRCVHKLILVLLDDKASSLQEIYSIAKNADYASIMRIDQTFAVRTTRVGRHDYTSIDISAAVGQAVVDYFIELKGLRPRVNLKKPDVEISVYVKDDEVVIGVNTTGESLHRRNYRVYDHPAALKTTLASCMLKWANWHGEELLDPMCGGGTIVIEAALMARKFPPGFFRRDLAFTKLMLYDRHRHLMEIERALSLVSRDQFPIIGFDISPKHIDGAKANAASAGVEDTISFKVRDATKDDSYNDLNAKFIVVNPPYGIRQSRPKIIRDMYVKMLKAISDRLSGSNLILITGAPRLFEEALNAVECELLELRKVKHGDLPATVYKVRV